MNADEFWSQVEKTPTCWLWHKTTKRGYGFVGHNGKAHRIAWELTFGGIPTGLCVCHRCDVRNCVNPAHLFIGTHGDNNRDARDKGRGVYPKGEHHGRAKLTERQVREIRSRAYRGNYSALGREFGVSVQTIHQIVLGLKWKHVAKLK
jgi:hypothetical protein